MRSSSTAWTERTTSADTGPALGLVLDHLTGSETEALAADANETMLQVDVGAPKSEQLSLPDAARACAADQRPVAPVDSVGEPVQLGCGHRPLLGMALDAAAVDPTRVAGDALVVHRLGAHLTEAQVRLGLDRATVRPDKSGVPSPDQLRGQTIEALLAERSHALGDPRKHMAAQLVLVDLPG